MKILAAVLLAFTVAACGSGGGTGHELDGLCRFASPALTNGAAARQMAADIQGALPHNYPNKARNLKIRVAVLKLMVAAGTAVPTSAEDQAPDLALVAAVKAQGDLATACA